MMETESDRLTTLDALETLADQLGASIMRMGAFDYVVDNAGQLPVIYCAEVPVESVVAS